ncbi:MAG: DUF4365 domain-containing protein [Rhodothermales bacterium]|nr:DUF4365 domain-containing protein [Rhodothermales bacterium]
MGNRWAHLNRQQVGAYSEYFVKMELTKLGFQVYTSEVDDRGIDFVARFERGPYFSVQVKSVRGLGYVFVRKSHFYLSDDNFLALVILREEEHPDLFLIPSVAWKRETPLFRDRNYEGKKSAPEWGLNVSQKNLALLREYDFEKTATAISAINT